MAKRAESWVVTSPFLQRFGSANAAHKRFLDWEKAGLLESLWKAGLAEHDAMRGIAWHRAQGERQ